MSRAGTTACQQALAAAEVDTKMTLKLGDGRCVAYRAFGAAHGPAVIALHGTPGSSLKFMATDAAARDLGLRVIAPDRWGYGATDAHPAPSLKAFAADMADMADRLEIDRFAILGVSGGGPYAAAIAAELGRRVTALALAAPVGPIAGEPDADISTFHRFCFGRLARSPRAVGGVFRIFRSALAISPDAGMRLAMLRISPSDRHALGRGETRLRLGRTFSDGLTPGVLGPVVDMRLFGAPWGLDLASAQPPARIWIGDQDQNVPQSAARRLARRLGACELVVLPGAGHLWIADNYPVVLRWIAQTLAATEAGQ